MTSLQRMFVIGCGIVGIGVGAAQAATVDTTMVFRAMRDELGRSMRELQLGDLQRPYYIEAQLALRHRSSVHAVLGSVDSRDTGTVATLTVRVRVGNGTFDNTNYFDVSLGFFGSSDDEEVFRNRRIGTDINYAMLRRELWLATDACYKQAVELYAKKLSAVKNRTRTDTTPDFRLLPPIATNDGSIGVPTVDLDDLSRTVTAVSAVFRDAPAVQASRAGIEVVPEETYYVNTEGRTSYKCEMFTGIEVLAVGQASDGMPIAETYSAYGIAPGDLPSRDSLVRAARGLATTLARLSTATSIEPYSGPVLFEGQAAAEIFAQIFAPNLVAQRSPLSDGGFSTNDRHSAFQNKIGGRVLPEWLSVQANPLRRTVGQSVVAGYYRIDDEGTPAEQVRLVEGGYLRALLTSRIPTKRLRSSNGHQRGGAAMLSVLELSASERSRQLDRKALKTRMMKLVKDRELPYGIIIRKALNQNLLFTGVFPLVGSDYPIPQGDDKLALLEVVRLYPDGREDIVRGVEAAGLSPALFKDLLAVGTTPTVYNYLAPAVAPAFITGGAQYVMTTAIVPDLLFEDVEVRPVEGDFPKPPFLANPVGSR